MDSARSDLSGTEPAIRFTEDQWHTPLARLEHYGLPVDILNALDDHGYYHIKDLARMTPENFGKIKNMSTKRLQILKHVLCVWYEKTS